MYKSLGNNYINVKSSSTTNPNNIDNVQALYNLNPDYIDFQGVERFGKAFVYAASDLRAFGELMIEYDWHNTTYKIPVKNLVVYNDLPNSLVDDNLIRGCSRVDAMIPALSNIAEGQKSKNLNLKYGGTFAISNEKKIAGNNTSLDPKEQREIEDRLRDKNTIATKTPIKSFRISNDLDKMIFDEQFAGDMQKITQGYEMNRDVMNYFLQGSKFNDQENAVVQWVQNSISEEGKLFAEGLEAYFGYRQQGKKVHMTYGHLPVMQVVEDQRADKRKKQAETLSTLMSIEGVELEQALEWAGLERSENIIRQ